MKRQLLICLFIMLSCIHAGAGELYNNAFPLLQRLNSVLVEYQNDDRKSPDYGGIICPGENLYHTRAGEAVFPLAYEYSRTGDRTRLKQALILADWLLRQQQDGGQWLETPETWTGTTTDQLMMLLLAYPIVEDKLSPARREAWLDGMRRAADYLERVMDNRFASINYCATTTASLAEAWLRFGDEKYLLKARSLARMIVAKMNHDCFIEGEGEREGLYKYGVDIGYNMEMSLWGLARYAALCGDVEVVQAVKRSTAAQLPFIYPDGMLDASAGIRSNKWTIYGSGTSDGCHPLFALLSGENPAYITAAVRNIRLMYSCFTGCGLLGPGPGHDRVMAAPPCIYPTFAKAKSLAMAISWVAEDRDTLAPLPLDKDYDVFYPSLGISIVRKGAFCGTVSAYNYKAKNGPNSKYMHRPAGGAMTALWVDGFGLLQASSQTEYHRWEPMSFPELSYIPRPLTPMISQECGDGEYTNLYDFDAVGVHESGDEVLVSVTGQLKNREYKKCGTAFRISYRFCADSLVKSYDVRRQTSEGPVRIIEPLVDNGRFSLEDDRTLRVERPGGAVALRCRGAKFSIDHDAAWRYAHVFPSLRCLPLVIEPDGPFELIYTFEKH